MPIYSMTGFARVEGSSATASWYWELRSVNGKGLDMRLRLPNGFENLEPKLRQITQTKLTRGTLHATLNLQRTASAIKVTLNEAVLSQVVEAAKRASEITGSELPTTANLLALRGVLDIDDLDSMSTSEDNEAIVSAFSTALDDLVTARSEEGQRLQKVIEDILAEISLQTQIAETAPARAPEAIRAKLSASIARLVESDQQLDPDRLHQEAVLIATRSDIEEEIKRLKAHIESANDLLQSGKPIGRRFDFLAQELQREANTLCSKSSDTTVTEAGLALKVKIDQLREQVQNLE